MAQHIGEYPPFNPLGKYTITKPSGWIVSRTDDWEAGLAFAEENGYHIGMSR